MARVAKITGETWGIGEATSIEFQTADCNLAAFDAGNDDTVCIFSN